MVRGQDPVAVDERPAASAIDGNEAEHSLRVGIDQHAIDERLLDRADPALRSVLAVVLSCGRLHAKTSEQKNRSRGDASCRA